MKRSIIILSVAACVLTQARADFREGYYDALDGLTREYLKAAAKESVTSHTRLSYTDLPTYWENSDVYPDLVENPSKAGEMCKRWWEMYSANVYLILPGQTARASYSANGMQREHVVPKSWWKENNDVEYTPAYSDMWNLFPSDGKANNAKSNYPVGETADNPKFNNGVTKVGVPKADCGGGVGMVFEPADEYKGDFARAYFYVATVYDHLQWTDSRNTVFERTSWPTFRPWAIDMLLDWSRRDPVSDKERMRNDAVEKSQGNRNPYVDFPELAEYVWGARMEQTFYIADQKGLTPTVPGSADVDYEEMTDAVIGYIDGGFSVLSSVGDLHVYDISGRVVMHVAAASTGDIFMLPRGIYIIMAEGLRAPQKLIVR